MNSSQYESVEPQDVWDALVAVSENQVSIFPDNTNISDIMENWIEKAGFPVVNVTLNDTTITMSQVYTRFSVNTKFAKNFSSNDF